MDLRTFITRKGKENYKKKYFEAFNQETTGTIFRSTTKKYKNFTVSCSVLVVWTTLSFVYSFYRLNFAYY